ncbi:MAG: MFS transporter [Pseudonocardia sp.]
MNTASSDRSVGPGVATRGRLVAWALWDAGSASYNAVILTFVFTPYYLIGTVGAGLDGDVSAAAWLGYSLGAAGLAIALLAPVAGQQADALGRRKLAVGVWTGATVVAMGALFAVREDPTYLWLGLGLVALGSITFELAEVSYFAMLSQVSTPATVGRVSGIGWMSGYLGGIVLLLLIYVGFVSGDGPTRGLLQVPTADGLNYRLIAVVAAAWFLVLALPLLIRVPELPRPSRPRRDVGRAYRTLVRDVRELYARAPHTVYFLGASALFRDGLAAVFALGGVLAVSVYGFDGGDVLVFGIAANVAAAAGALAGGWFDDRFGPKPVILVSLAGLVLAGVTLLFLSGPSAFWVFGLLLTVFVGPAQSASRSFLSRLAPPGREGQLFGLYATTGRAVSFLAPTLFAVFASVFASDRAGIVGILLVVVLGLLALVPVRPPITQRVTPV